MFDKLFKIFLAVVLLIGLRLAWGAREGANNGRYVYQFRADRSQDVLLDTRTGRLFYLNILNGPEHGQTPVSLEENPLTGEQSNHWAW